MHTKTKKIITYLLFVILLGGVAFYASMEDYQKANMASFLSQTFSSSEQQLSPSIEVFSLKNSEQIDWRILVRIRDLKGFGPKSEEILAEVNINSVEEFMDIDPFELYKQLKLKVKGQA